MGRLALRLICMIKANTEPLALQNIERLSGSVDDIKRTLRRKLLERAVALKGHGSTGAFFNHCQAIQLSVIAQVVRFQSLNDQPTIRISLADIRPFHCVSLTTLPEGFTPTLSLPAACWKYRTRPG